MSSLLEVSTHSRISKMTFAGVTRYLTSESLMKSTNVRSVTSSAERLIENWTSLHERRENDFSTITLVMERRCPPFFAAKRNFHGAMTNRGSAGSRMRTRHSILRVEIKEGELSWISWQNGTRRFFSSANLTSETISRLSRKKSLEKSFESKSTAGSPTSRD